MKEETEVKALNGFTALSNEELVNAMRNNICPADDDLKGWIIFSLKFFIVVTLAILAYKVGYVVTYLITKWI